VVASFQPRFRTAISQKQATEISIILAFETGSLKTVPN
jgi:hypothetical protein